MTTNNHDKQKELQAQWDAEKAFAEKIIYIVRAIFSNLANIADIVNRYAGITGMLTIGVNIVSMAPAAIVGPFAYMFNLIFTLTNDKISIANKIVSTITASGSTGASLASLILHSIALPLIVVSASLGFIKESWGLGELLYRRYAKNEAVTSKEWFDAVQGVVLASISVIGAAMLFFPPTIPFAYALFAAVGVYRFFDSIGKNPIKILFNYYENNETAAPTIDSTTTKIENTLHASLENDVKAPSQQFETAEKVKATTDWTPVYPSATFFAEKVEVSDDTPVNEPDSAPAMKAL